MILVYAIFFLFALVSLLAFLEDRIEAKQKMFIYYAIGVVLVLLAGFREVGIDPDSDTYEKYFLNYNDITLLDAVEYSFILLCQILRNFTDDVHSIFLLYAFFGVLLKMTVFKRYSDSIFLLLLVYISYFYELHETTQIRTGILSAVFLWAILYIAESRRWVAFGLIMIGTVFHLSGLALLPVLFLNNKPLNWKWVCFWGMVIPMSYVVARLMSSFSLVSEIPYIGGKIENYQNLEDSGRNMVSAVNIFSPFHMFSVLVFYYLLFFYKTIQEKDKYFPLLLKLYAVGLASYAAFSFLPVFAERISLLYRIVIVALFADVCHTIVPRWCGILAVMLIGFVYLNYVMRSMYDFTILLK